MKAKTHRRHRERGGGHFFWTECRKGTRGRKLAELSSEVTCEECREVMARQSSAVIKQALFIRRIGVVEHARRKMEAMKLNADAFKSQMKLMAMQFKLQ